MATELTPDSHLHQALLRLARDTVTAPGALLYFRAPEGTQLRLPGCWMPVESLAISTMEIHAFRKGDPQNGPEPAHVL
jgi:hypothetical protein